MKLATPTYLVLPVLAATAMLTNVAQAGSRNFPQHTTYTTGTIKPNNVTQSSMDSAVKTVWSSWKGAYLRTAGTGKYYVRYNSAGETVSEAHGYGMLLAVIMEGSDSMAKTYFDGLYNYYKAHPSVNNSALMAWKQDSSFHNIEGADSATDGDMDIAYSLLLADKQWGSSGSINYLSAAKSIINAILLDDVGHTRWSTRLGDWANTSTTTKNTRPSDFMLQHMKSYLAATGDTHWTNVVNTTFNIINTLFNNYSANTGLLPDFATDSNGWRPVAANFLEGPDDGHYNYNSCRTPWRITTDYLMTGDTRALNQLKKMNSWIKNKTGGNPSNVHAGYTLGGSSTTSSYDTCFTIPFGVSAMVEASNQAWLNAIWSKAAGTGKENYYNDSIKLLSMIVMSGNWWAPSSTSVGTAPTITSSPVTTATAGSAYSYDVNANGSPAPTFSLTTAPSGMTISASSGLISWTPSSSGPFSVTVKAANGVSPDASQSFTINVAAQPVAPTITSTAVTTATVSVAYTYDVEATGQPNPTFSLTTAPSGMTISSSTGVISWTPTAAGSFPVTVKAANGVSPDATQSFNLVVQGPPQHGGTFEAETLAVEGSSGDTVRVLVESSASAGQSLMNDTNAIGDFVTLRIPNIAAGTYSVSVRFKKHNTRGTVQTMIGKIGGTLGNLGSPIDLYASSVSYFTVTLGTWTPGSNSDKQISFKIVGKNASSSGFTQCIDSITLTPQ